MAVQTHRHILVPTGSGEKEGFPGKNIVRRKEWHKDFQE
jgi:hypothetical protein